MRVEATVFNLMQIGELAKESLGDDVKKVITTVPWQQIYGLRNRIVHGYSGVNIPRSGMDPARPAVGIGLF